MNGVLCLKRTRPRKAKRYSGPMPSVLVALGTNVGDRLGNLNGALAALQTSMCVESTSAIYETAPMYVEDQPTFLNAAVKCQTDKGPLTVLRLLKSIESSVGRQTRERFGPREIDLDLVGYGALSYIFSDGDRTVLQVPHPKTPERRFVLAPLADIDPDGFLPGVGRISELLSQTNDQTQSVKKLTDAIFSVQRD